MFKWKNHEKYLGFVGRSRKILFNNIREQVEKRLQEWKEKLLSHAGREVLIKPVAQAVHTYELFFLPKQFCAEVNSLMGKFSWGQKKK